MTKPFFQCYGLLILVCHASERKTIISEIGTDDDTLEALRALLLEHVWLLGRGEAVLGDIPEMGDAPEVELSAVTQCDDHIAPTPR